MKRHRRSCSHAHARSRHCCSPAAPAARGPAAKTAAKAAGRDDGRAFPVTVTDDATARSPSTRARAHRQPRAGEHRDRRRARPAARRLVGVTTYDDYPAEVKTSPKVGDFMTPEPRGDRRGEARRRARDRRRAGRRHRKLEGARAPRCSSSTRRRSRRCTTSIADGRRGDRRRRRGRRGRRRHEAPTSPTVARRGRRRASR